MVKIIKRNRLQENSTNDTGAILLKNNLKENEERLRSIFEGDDTIIFRNLKTQDGIRCMLIFVDGMVNTDIINENVLMPLMSNCIPAEIAGANILDYLTERIIISDDIKRSPDVDELVGSILYGDSVLLIDGQEEAILMNTKGWQVRAITEPTSERSIKGPREGFVESLVINTSLIRRRFRNPGLKFKYMELGRRTKTQISICYIEGLANKKVMDELVKRIGGIDMDGVLGANYIEEMISDSPFSPFVTTGFSEKPDKIVGGLLEGRVAVIIDGTPVVLTVPYIFMEYFQSYQDYYDNYILASFNRMMRYLSFFLTTSVAPIYVALTTYHQEMVPTPLLLSITSARQGVPFPTIVEAFGMILMFEILRESGTRLPEPVGSAISIVGALVIGQAAVEAKFVSAPMIIVVALTGITSFLVYKMNNALIVIRFIFLILTGLLGLYGYIFGIIGLFLHLMSMRSFGVPYMLNLGSLNKQDIKDTIIRAPWWYMYYRPKLIGRNDPIRKPDAKPNKKE